MTLLRLHGIPCVERDGAEPLPLSAREAALLAWLHLEGPTARAPLAGRLWAGGDESKARANLRQLLLRLRRAAGEVLTERAGLLSLADGVRVAPPDGRLLGPLEFDDTPELAEWLDGRREAERRARLREGLAQARQALQEARLDAALAAADEVLIADPAAEEAHRLRMQVFWQRGDRAAAVQAWDDCRLALRQQFGVPPSAVTNELGHRILAEEAAVQGPPAAAPLPDALLRPAALIGRAAERDRLCAALRGGQGAVVRGPGGIGKSRLMAAVAESLEPALWVGCRPGDEHVPGAVASRLVAAAVARFDPALDSQTRSDIQRLIPTSGTPAVELRSALEHRRVLASVARTMLACHARGMRLVVVDDLQFADDLSVEAIAVVIGGWVAEPAKSTAVPLFGCRPDELREPARRLVAILEDSGRSLRVDLAPLDAGALDALLGELPLPPAFAGRREALAQALHASVGGNPAHWMESLKSLWRDAPAHWQPGQPLPLPDGLRAQVRRRLERLGDAALQLAQLAAVAQRDFSLPLAAMALGRAPLGLAPLFAELEAAQVFQRGGFAHDLVADAVDASVPPSLRGPLHRLVAEHLQGADGDPASVAWHLDAAGEHRAAAPWHRRAGDQARARWQLHDAARHYEAAAAALDGAATGPDREQRLACLRRAAWARTGAGQMAESEALLERAVAIALPGPERLAVTCSRAMAWLSLRRLGPLREGLAQLLEALERPFPGWAEAEHDQVWMSFAVACRFSRLAARALRVVPGTGRPDGRPTRVERVAIGMLHRLAGDPAAALPLLAPALTEAIEARLFNQAYNGGHQWARAALMLGDEAALDHALAALRLCAREAGLGPALTVDVEQVEAMRWLARGEPGQALALIEAARRRLAALPGARPRLQLELVAATAQAALGGLDEAARLVDGLPEGDGGPDADLAWRASLGAQLALARGGDVQPWLDRLAAHDPHDGADGSASLERLCLQAMAGQAPVERAWARAQQAGRRPLGHALGQPLPAGTLRDPWLYPLPAA